jgi:hypothetical protein
MAAESTPKKSFLKSVLGSFVELDEAPSAVQPQQAKAPQQPAMPIGQPAQGIHPIINRDMYDSLIKTVLARKTPYTALIEASQRLEAVIPDEGTRIKSAYVMVTTDGQRSMSTITQAIDVHIRDIDGELMRFKATTEQANASKVGALRANADGVSARVQASRQRIEAMTKEIETLTLKINEDVVEEQRLRAEADAAEREVENIAIQFQDAAQTVRDELIARKTSLSTLII